MQLIYLKTIQANDILNLIVSIIHIESGVRSDSDTAFWYFVGWKIGISGIF